MGKTVTGLKLCNHTYVRSHRGPQEPAHLSIHLHMPVGHRHMPGNPLGYQALEGLVTQRGNTQASVT